MAHPYSTGQLQEVQRTTVWLKLVHNSCKWVKATKSLPCVQQISIQGLKHGQTLAEFQYDKVKNGVSHQALIVPLQWTIDCVVGQAKDGDVSGELVAL